MPVRKTPAEAQAAGEPPASIAVLNLFGQQATFPVNLYLVGIIVVLVSGLVAMDFISRGGISQTIQKVQNLSVLDTWRRNMEQRPALMRDECEKRHE